jgi:phosphotransacetylase
MRLAVKQHVSRSHPRTKIRICACAAAAGSVSALIARLSCCCCLVLQVLVYGDCAVNVAPGSTDLASIAACSADTAAAFGIEPRVAMLSYSTMGSGAGPDVSVVLACG